MEEIIDIKSIKEEFESNFVFNENIKAAMNSKELMKFEYLEYKKSFGTTLIPQTNGLYKKVYLIDTCNFLAGLDTLEMPQDLLIIQVYPDTTSFDRIDRDIKNTLETQISLIGGTMGLFTGPSVQPI